jgi:hypothetical protein
MSRSTVRGDAGTNRRGLLITDVDGTQCVAGPVYSEQAAEREAGPLRALGATVSALPFYSTREFRDLAGQPDPSPFPEHAKMAAAAGRTQPVGAFLKWLAGQGLVLARYDRHDELVQHYETIAALLARWVDVDQATVDAEKEAMLAQLRARPGRQS